MGVRQVKMSHSLYTTYTRVQGTEGLPRDAHLGEESPQAYL